MRRASPGHRMTYAIAICRHADLRTKTQMFRLIASALALSCVLTTPSRAEIKTLICSVSLATFIIDIDFTKQTVSMSVPQGGTRSVTWPAEITDRSVSWWTEDHYLLSIDRTTGIFTGGANGEQEGACKRADGKVF